jgi:hypothetical protein
MGCYPDDVMGWPLCDAITTLSRHTRPHIQLAVIKYKCWFQNRCDQIPTHKVPPHLHTKPRVGTGAIVACRQACSRSLAQDPASNAALPPPSCDPHLRSPLLLRRLVASREQEQLQMHRPSASACVPSSLDYSSALGPFEQKEDFAGLLRLCQDLAVFVSQLAQGLPCHGNTTRQQKIQ